MISAFQTFGTAIRTTRHAAGRGPSPFYIRIYSVLILLIGSVPVIPNKATVSPWEGYFIWSNNNNITMLVND